MKSFVNLDVQEYKELKPGHYLHNEGEVRYYHMPEVNWHPEAEETICRQVRELVEAAVQKRVRTDLPIATFLSGGLDSSIVHLLCCRYHNNVTAIIIGNETAEDVLYAKRLCHDFNLPYHHIETSGENLLNNIPEIIYQIETFEPNPIRGSILSMKLAECAHQLGFKVVICGEGSDEIFGGYGDFLFLEEAAAFKQRIDDLLADLYRTQLLRIDRTGMAYAVEVREPFLDRALVEYTLNIHPSLKTASLKTGEKTTKYILREAFKDLLPEYIYARPKMTLMEGAGIGGVEKNKGVSYSFARDHVSDQEWVQIKETYPCFSLQNKEEGYFCQLFQQHFSKADFATKRVTNAQKEIKKIHEHCAEKY
jgi:asparagine synthase (glutamine-hydrolysing)